MPGPTPAMIAKALDMVGWFVQVGCMVVRFRVALKVESIEEVV